jgi:hypothetical protein
MGGKRQSGRYKKGARKNKNGIKTMAAKMSALLKQDWVLVFLKINNCGHSHG